MEVRGPNPCACDDELERGMFLSLWETKAHCALDPPEQTRAEPSRPEHTRAEPSRPEQTRADPRRWLT